MRGAPADLSDGRSRPGRTMNRTAVACAVVAGLAWMTGFVLFLAIGVNTVVQTGDASGMLLGFLMYGAWALALGVLLLRRPSRAIFAVSLAFAAFLLVLYGPIAAPGLSLQDLSWLSYVPDVTAAAASSVGLIAAGRS